MNEHDLSDGQWKVAVVLTVALLGWLCFNNSGYIGAQRKITSLDEAPHATNSLQAHVSGRIVSPDIKSFGALYSPLDDSEADLGAQGDQVPAEAAMTAPRVE